MKKLFTKRNIPFLILAALVVIALILGGIVLVNKLAGNDKPVVQRGETEVIFSFDSYKEITGAQIRMDNQFGETKINTDEQYITEGKGSWMVKPQGNYGKPGAFPAFNMLCTNTTFKVTDFTDFDKVMMDVYNASEEDVQMQWYFNLKDRDAASATTPIETYTLKAGEWNTCEIDLSTDVYRISLDVKEITGMHVTFMTVKENKEDTVPELYLDNIRGHYGEVDREAMKLDYSFEKGVTFEADMEHYAFKSSAGKNILTLSRGKWSDIDVEPYDKDACGEYLLVGDGTGGIWPASMVKLDKTYPKGSYFTFMLYVDVNEVVAEGLNYQVESRAGKTNGTRNTIVNGVSRFNRWTQVTIQLAEDTDAVYFFINFDDRSGEENSIIGSEMAMFYMDNFYIKEAYEGNFDNGVSFEEERQELLFSDTFRASNYMSLSRMAYDNTSIKDTVDRELLGDYVLVGDAYGAKWPYMRVNFGKTYPAGSILTFWVYVEGDPAACTGTDEVGKVEFQSSGAKYIQTGLKMNKWTKVYFTLTADSAGGNMFANLSNSKTNEYIFQESPEVTVYWDAYEIAAPKNFTGNFDEVIDFEDAKDEEAFAVGTERYKELGRVKYADTGIASVTDKAQYGAYGLMGEVEKGTQYAAIDVNFGKTYKAGSTLTFKMYVEAKGNTDERINVAYKTLKNKLLADTIQKYNRWITISYTLPEDMDSMKIMIDDKWNKETGMVAKNVYFDNFKISPAFTGNFDEKIDFEDAEDANAITNGSETYNTLDRVAYADTSIASKADAATYGKYGFRGTINEGVQYSTINVNLGKNYVAGSTLKFKMYIEGTGNASNDINVTFKNSTNKLLKDSIQKYNKWLDVEYELSQDLSSIRIMIDDKWNKDTGMVAKNVYFDNFEILPPVTFEGNFDEKVDFEEAEDADAFEISAEKFTSLERVTYASTSLASKADEAIYGKYTLLGKVAEGSQYAGVDVNFGKAYPAGSTLVFKVYIEADGFASNQINVTFKDAGKVVSDSIKGYNKWITMSYTFKEDMNGIKIMLDDKWNKESGMVGKNVYFDNFEIVAPFEGDFSEWIDFEDTEDANAFTYGGDLYESISRVAYADTTMKEKADEATYGAYGLRGVTNVDQQYASMNVNFGKTYPAGSTFCYSVYIEAEGYASQNINVTTKRGDTGKWFADSIKNFNKWIDITCTLPEDLDSVILTIDDKHNKETGMVVKNVYYDNLRVYTPEEWAEEQYQPDFQTGIAFDYIKDGKLFEVVDNSGSKFLSLMRAKYADNVSMAADEAIYGTYGLLGIVTSGNPSPAMKVNFGTTYGEDMELCFAMYVQAEAATGQYRVAGSTYNYNEWVTVSIPITGDCTSLDVAFSDMQITGTAQVYLDNVVVVDTYKPNFFTKVNFENTKDARAFDTPYTGGEASSLTCVDYSATGNLGTQDANAYGTYGLKMTAPEAGAVNYPSMEIDLGDVYPAGTKISFDWYAARTDGATNGSMRLDWWSILDDAGTRGENTYGWMGYYNQWKSAEITLKEATSVVKLMVQVNKISGASLGTTISAIYFDNFKATATVAFETGVGMETFVELGAFAANATESDIARVALADTSIAGQASATDHGSYVIMQQVLANKLWPSLTVTFDKAYPKNTKFSFDVYVEVPQSIIDASTDTDNDVKIEGLGQYKFIKYNTWETIEWTLGQAYTGTVLWPNFDQDGLSFTDGQVRVYYDNFKMTVPTIDFATGVGFENAGEESVVFLSTQPMDAISRVSYANTSLAGKVDAKYGAYAMMGTDAGTGDAYKYKRFYIETGTLAIGTTITFDYYVEADTTVIGNNNFARGVVADGSHNKAYAAASFNKWNTITYTTTQANTSIGLFLEYKFGSTQNVAKKVYIDNIKITAPTP